MVNTMIELPPKGGFICDLCRRNKMITNKGVQPPSFYMTRTTIVGLVFKVSSTVTAQYRIFIFLCCVFPSYLWYLMFYGNLLNNYIIFSLHLRMVQKVDWSQAWNLTSCRTFFPSWDVFYRFVKN